jgi:Fe-S cluster assembly protein SufD
MKASVIPAWLKTSEYEKAVSQAPSWLLEFRQKHWDAFLKNGLPGPKHEHWKYADLEYLNKQDYQLSTLPDDISHLYDVIHQHRLQKDESILMVFVNGHFVPALSDLAKLPDNVIACNMSQAYRQHADSVADSIKESIVGQIISGDAQADKKNQASNHPFASLNAALFVDGLYLEVPQACVLTTPIHLLYLNIGHENFVTHPHNIFILRKASEITLAEEHFSLTDCSYMANIVTSIHLDQDAKLHHCKIQNEGKKAVHIANYFIRQKKSSQFSHLNFSFGSLFARDDVVIKLLEPGADCYTAGFYHLRDSNQYIDNHVDITHAAPHGNSDMLYKGIVDNKSRAVFNGRLLVEQGAQKITAYQANHNLLLSPQAEAYSKPELEIYADDVKCKHGSATGQLDEDALFYLRSRGIPREEAIGILLQGYAQEVLQRITHAGIKMRIEEML